MKHVQGDLLNHVNIAIVIIIPSMNTANKMGFLCLKSSYLFHLVKGATLLDGNEYAFTFKEYTGISNCIPQNNVECHYLSLPDLPASGTKDLIWYHSMTTSSVFTIHSVAKPNPNSHTYPCRKIDEK